MLPAPVIEASQHAGGAAHSSGPALALSCAAPRQILNSGCYRSRCSILPHSANNACRKLSRQHRLTPTSQKLAKRARLQEGVWLTWPDSIIVSSASCAPLTMSSEPFVCRLQAHADVKRPDTPLPTRLGAPIAAPAKVHGTIASPALRDVAAKPKSSDPSCTER